MKNLFKSLAAFQQECPVIRKDAKGYNYLYADIMSIWKVTKPLLKKHGLGIAQPLKGKCIETIIFHAESGESISGTVKLPTHLINYKEVEKKGKNGDPYKVNTIPGFEGMNPAQAFGALITYFKRYAFLSTTGLITDEDGDIDSVIGLPKLEENSGKYQEAVRFLNGGGKIASIEKKYDLSDVREQLLNDAV